MLSGPCAQCGIKVQRGAGVFCANFSHGRGPWTPCHMVWCGKCYRPTLNDHFPVLQPKDKQGNVIDMAREEQRFRQARNGDHLMISFQCDLCHFRNIQGRDPMGSVTDDNLMTCIRRANLDAFWAREPGTVSANLYDARRSVTTQVDCLGIISGGFRPLGPFPLRDTCGMIPAATMLMRSLDAGRNDKTVQFGTIRKVRSTFTNLHNASVNGMGSSTLMGDGRKCTDSLTHSLYGTTDSSRDVTNEWVTLSNQIWLSRLK